MTLYKEKFVDYFSSARNEILDLLPKWSENVLEIGCGTGSTLEMIKSKGYCRKTYGIEIFEGAANVARAHVDEVLHMDIERQLPIDGLGKFDLILILDVLEHLIDPWNTLKRIVQHHLHEDGSIIISLPNARHFTLTLPLLIKGDFEYKERGILDKTHLRFFTLKTGSAMIENAGLQIKKIKRTSLENNLNSGKLNTVTFGLFAEFLTSQHIYLANSKHQKLREATKH